MPPVREPPVRVHLSGYTCPDPPVRVHLSGSTFWYSAVALRAVTAQLIGQPSYWSGRVRSRNLLAPCKRGASLWVCAWAHIRGDKRPSVVCCNDFGAAGHSPGWKFIFVSLTIPKIPFDLWWNADWVGTRAAERHLVWGYLGGSGGSRVLSVPSVLCVLIGY